MNFNLPLVYRGVLKLITFLTVHLENSFFELKKVLLIQKNCL